MFFFRLHTLFRFNLLLFFLLLSDSQFVYFAQSCLDESNHWSVMREPFNKLVVSSHYLFTSRKFCFFQRDQIRFSFFFINKKWLIESYLWNYDYKVRVLPPVPPKPPKRGILKGPRNCTSSRDLPNRQSNSHNTSTDNADLIKNTLQNEVITYENFASKRAITATSDNHHSEEVKIG